MKIDEALQIVYDLAQQNVLTEQQVAGSPELEDERNWQLEALNTVHDFAINVVAEGRAEPSDSVRESILLVSRALVVLAKATQDQYTMGFCESTAEQIKEKLEGDKCLNSR